MEWLLLGAVVIVAGLLALAVRTAGATRFWLNRRPRTWDHALPRRRCLQCRGTGWVNREPERTLNFVGDGFEDRHTPAIMCPSCGGTGTAPER
jgi:hypothetical protein